MVIFLLSCKQKVVQFCLVPAHVGILGNETSNQLAKEGSLRQPMKKGITHSDYIPGIRESISFTWQFAWNLKLSNKMREITEYIRPWVYSSISRRRETALCRLGIGHAWFSHSYLMSKDHQISVMIVLFLRQSSIY